jgi:hypothetical protein
MISRVAGCAEARAITEATKEMQVKPAELGT